MATILLIFSAYHRSLEADRRVRWVATSCRHGVIHATHRTAQTSTLATRLARPVKIAPSRATELAARLTPRPHRERHRDNPVHVVRDPLAGVVTRKRRVGGATGHTSGQVDRVAVGEFPYLGAHLLKPSHPADAAQKVGSRRYAPLRRVVR